MCYNERRGPPDDYIICSKEVAPMISEVEIDVLVPWNPHKAIRFKIKRSPKEVKIRRLKIAKRFRYEKGEKGEIVAWKIDEGEYERLYESKAGEAQAAINLSLIHI